MQNYLSLTAIALLASGCAAKSTPSEPVPAVAAEIDEAVEVPAEEPKAASSTTLADAVTWMPANPDREDGPHMALVSGNPQEGAFTFMVKFPAGYGDPVHSHPSDFTGILTSGELSHGRSAEDFDLVSQGGALVQPANEAHYTGCSDAGDCVLVGHMSGAMATVPSDAPVEGEMAYSVTNAEGIGYEALNPKQPQGPKWRCFPATAWPGRFGHLCTCPQGRQVRCIPIPAPTVLCC